MPHLKVDGVSVGPFKFQRFIRLSKYKRRIYADPSALDKPVILFRFFRSEFDRI